MGLMINRLDNEISFNYSLSLDNHTYFLSLSSMELKKLIGNQYEKYFNLSDNEKFRYKEFFDETRIDYIAQGLIDGTWMAHVEFCVNILKESRINIVCDEEKKTIILPIDSEVALLEQYLTYFAIEKTFLLEQELGERMFIVKLTNYDIDVLQEFFSQSIKEGSRKKGI